MLRCSATKGQWGLVNTKERYMPNNGRNGFDKYEGDCDKVWLFRLRSSYCKIEREVESHAHKVLLEPVFDLNADIGRKWASWCPSTRIMTFAAALLRNYEWGAVEHVMRHEIAHQIVSEIFGMDCYGVAHGAAWAEACKIVNIEPVRCDSQAFLSSFKGTMESPLVDKIRKIIIHANDKAATEAEAETFMRKARELMLRHDIAMTDVMGTERLFVTRPFGPLFKRWGSYMWRLGNLLADYYDVKHIRTFGPNGTKRLELFGEPDKLDIAEYVGHALLNQAEMLYEAERKKVHAKKAELRKKDKEDGLMYRRRTKLSKNAYMEGIISGYASKLSMDAQAVVHRVGVEVAKEKAEEAGRKYTDGDCAIVPVYNDKLLDEMYGKEYPRLVTLRAASARWEGFEGGYNDGKNLRLSKGVQGGGNCGKLLAG